MSQLMQPAILIISQDEIESALIESLLDHHGMKVLTAHDRKTALKLAKSNPIDLAICGIQVGDQSGTDITAAIRNLKDRQDVPVLFTSSVQVPDIILRRHESGSSFHIKTPFDNDVFVELVERALWMPHLISAHIEAVHSKEPLKQPHFPLGAPLPTNQTILNTTNSSTQSF